MAGKNINPKTLEAELSKSMMNDLERIEYGLSTHWKWIAGVAAGVLILVAVIIFAAAHQRSAKRDAAEALALAADAPALTAALKTYGSSSAAPAARYRLAKLYIGAKEYDGALTELQQLKSAAEPLKTQAAMSEAYVYELMGKTEAAAAAFAGIGRDTNAAPAVRAEASLNAGRLFVRLKDLKQAVAVLSRSASMPGNSRIAGTWNEMAKALLNAIESGEYGPYAPAAETR